MWNTAEYFYHWLLQCETQLTISTIDYFNVKHRWLLLPLTTSMWNTADYFYHWLLQRETQLTISTIDYFNVKHSWIFIPLTTSMWNTAEYFCHWILQCETQLTISASDYFKSYVFALAVHFFIHMPFLSDVTNNILRVMTYISFEDLFYVEPSYDSVRMIILPGSYIWYAFIFICLTLVEEELSTLPEHISPSPDFLWGSGYSIFSFMCKFYRSLFVLFLLTIVLSVLLRFTDSDYPFGIFKLFLINESTTVIKTISVLSITIRFIHVLY